MVRSRSRPRAGARESLRTRLSARSGAARTYIGEGLSPAATARSNSCRSSAAARRRWLSPISRAGRGSRRAQSSADAPLQAHDRIRWSALRRVAAAGQRPVRAGGGRERHRKPDRRLSPVQAAGRTDAGVHAKGQVVHVDLAKDWRGDRLRDALNAHLRLFPVAIASAERVDGTFEARFSATKRHYLYRILNRRARRSTNGLRLAWRGARRRHARGGAGAGRPAQISRRSGRPSARQFAGANAGNSST